MTLTYPRYFFDSIAEAEFDLDQGTVLNPEEGGRTPAVRIAQPLWRGKFRSGKLYGDRLGEAEAWKGSLDDGINAFLGRHPDRPFPRAHPRGFDGMTRAVGGSFDGAAISWSLDSSRTQLSCDGLPAGFELRRGDFADFIWSSGNRRFLIRFLEGQTGAEGAIANIAFQPAAPVWLPSGAILNFARPSCLMKMVPGSASLPISFGGRGVLNFEAVQDLDA